MRNLRSLVPALKLVMITSAVILLFSANLLAQSSTKINELERMSREYKYKLDSHRTQLYDDLITSEAQPQKNLNANPDIELMYIDDMGHPVFYEMQNLTAAQTISTDEVWPGGSGGFNLTGVNTISGELALWDGGGVLTTHQELSGSVTQMDSPGGTHYHSTHVAGTMIADGDVSAAQGMSYQGNLEAWDWDYDDSEMASEAAGDLRISNHSYGFVAGWYYDYSSYEWVWYGNTSVSETEDYGFGFYSAEVAAWDSIAYNAPYYTIVKSAGNDRNDNGPSGGEGHWAWYDSSSSWEWNYVTRDPDGGTSGYDCIGWRGNAKNIISVGAVEDIPGGYSSPGDVTVTDYSGWGPTDDGRIKPDIVANGSRLYSCFDDDNSSYGSIGGTSMSSPTVSGSLNLLLHYYESSHSGVTPRSATMKALMIHSADEAGIYTGPDFQHGWGLMNTQKAAEVIQTDSIYGGYIMEDILNNGETKYFSINNTSGEPIRMTIAWTDPAGTPPSAQVDPSDIMLVHDLDMTLEHIPGTNMYYPYVLDPANPSYAATTGDNFRDNVEQVYIASPSPGQYRVAISHKNSLSSTQHFSIISSHQVGIYTPNSPPVAVCASGINVPVDSNCQAFVSADDGSYDPDGDPITLEQHPPSPYTVGVTGIYLVVTDSTGLKDSCYTEITVYDDIDPVAICPSDITVDNELDECGAFVTFAIDASDNCSVASVIATPSSGSFFDVGTTQVTVTATDGSANTGVCFFDVIVNDTQPPFVPCPATIVVANDPGECGAVVEFGYEASDNCGVLETSAVPPSGSFFDAGTTEVTLIAIDIHDNADTCGFEITVNDTELPFVPCPSNIVVDNDPGECGAIVEFGFAADDNCEIEEALADPPSGSFFPVGNTTVILRATDTSDNTDSCHFIVTVNDTIAPSAECPTDMELTYDPGVEGAIGVFSSVYDDNCSDGSIVCDPPSGSVFPLGITTVYCVATDSTGNVDSCSFVVEVVIPDGYKYLPGDANMSAGAWPPVVIGSDVTYMVNYFRAINPPCLLDGFYCAADANGDCSVIGADVTFLVSYFRGFNTLIYCPDYETIWHSSEELPLDAPGNWPGCDIPVISIDDSNTNGDDLR